MLTHWTGSETDPIWIKTDWPSDIARGLFSFRTHGVSRGQFASLNVGYHVPDDATAVTENRNRCANEIGGALSDWVVGEQVHGTKVAVVDERHRGMGATANAAPVPGVDALVTQVPGLSLAVMSADCVPILFFDDVQRVVGVAHSGWKGTVGHIAANVISTMQQSFGTRPEHVEVWLGPSIRQCCYEVDSTVAEPIASSFGEKVLQARLSREGKWLLHMQACIKQDLVRVGVPTENIHDTGVCSGCRTDVLYSHRMEQGKTGRFLGLARLQNTGGETK